MISTQVKNNECVNIISISIKYNTQYVIHDLRMLNYANKLYLVSLQRKSVYSSICWKRIYIISNCKHRFYDFKLSSTYC